MTWSSPWKVFLSDADDDHIHDDHDDYDDGGDDDDAGDDDADVGCFASLSLQRAEGLLGSGKFCSRRMNVQGFENDSWSLLCS